VFSIPKAEFTILIWRKPHGLCRYESVRKVLFMWAFAAHTQLSLAFVHNILQKLLIIKVSCRKSDFETFRTASELI